MLIRDNYNSILSGYDLYLPKESNSLPSADSGFKLWTQKASAKKHFLISCTGFSYFGSSGYTQGLQDFT